jgi:hypothetical protein
MRRIRRVGIDYHVAIDQHYYSVPYRFAKDQVEVRPALAPIILKAPRHRYIRILKSP